MEQKDSYHYYCTGLGYFERGEFESALENFLRSSELEAHFKTSERIAHTLRKLGRPKEADYFLEQAYRLNPKNDKIGTEYAGLMLRRGQTSPAKEILKEIICRNPSYGPGWKLAAELGEQTELSDIIDKVMEKFSLRMIPGSGRKLIAGLSRKSELAEISEKLKEKSGSEHGQKLAAELIRKSKFADIVEKVRMESGSGKMPKYGQKPSLEPISKFSSAE